LASTFILFTFAFAFHVSFGLEMVEFSTVGTSIRSLCLSLIGSETFQYSQLYQKNSWMAPFLITTFSFLGFFLILTLVIAIVENSYTESVKMYNESKGKPTNLRAWYDAVKLMLAGSNLPSNRFRRARLPTRSSPTRSEIASKPSVHTATVVPIREWLASVNPLLEQYSEGFVEHGYENTSVLMEATEQGIEAAANVISIKMGHRQIFSNAVAALKSEEEAGRRIKGPFLCTPEPSAKESQGRLIAA
jgi:hypothetical protein